MKLLLDENLPHQLQAELAGHDCSTVAYMGWAGVENGELLSRAAAHGFDALITKDANLQYQQNLAAVPLAVVLLQLLRTTSTTCGRLCQLCLLRLKAYCLTK